MQQDQNQANYDFIFNSSNKPQKSGGLPKMSKPLTFVVLVVILMLALIIVGSILGNKKKSVLGLPDIYGQSQEIIRVSTQEQPLMRDPGAIAILATTRSILTSNQTDLKSYMGTHKIRLDPKKMATFINKNTDTSLATALQNNNLDAAYLTYLKGALNAYLRSVQSAYSSTSDSKAKNILSGAYTNVQTLTESKVFSTVN